MGILPSPPKICGTPNGPPIAANRIKPRDGRHLAYKEHGVSKELAKHKLIFVHGLTSCRHDEVLVTHSSPVPLLRCFVCLIRSVCFQEVVEELGIYSVSFDRPGCGESDPHPNRTPKSLALDIEELADQLGLGPKFYVVGYSMGGLAVWSCLKYIPHRLAGTTMMAPVVNYWWPGLPANLSEEAWNTQKLFPASAVFSGRPEVFSPHDVQMQPRIAYKRNCKGVVTQQGVSKSLHREMNVVFGNWGFNPLDLDNPFPDNKGSVHIWMGDEDQLVRVILQRYIAKRLPWIKYNEITGGGHLFVFADGMSEAILRALVVDASNIRMSILTGIDGFLPNLI